MQPLRTHHFRASGLVPRFKGSKPKLAGRLHA